MGGDADGAAGLMVEDAGTAGIMAATAGIDDIALDGPGDEWVTVPDRAGRAKVRSCTPKPSTMSVRSDSRKSRMPCCH
jgi:hypothetical protein